MVGQYPLRRLAGTHKPYDAVVRTVCQECTVGCGLLVYLTEGVVTDIHGDEEHPVNRGKLCGKGIAFHQGLNHPDRISRVSQRKSLDDSLQTVDDWEKTLDYLAEKLRKIRARYGPRSLMIGCDPDAGLDFYIGALRFARLWGTPHVFHPLYSPGGMSTYPADIIGSVPRCDDWVHSRCIFLIEADLATTHPVAFSRLLDARALGAVVVALDSRFTTTMSKADIALRIKPESGNKIGLALMSAILEDGFHDQAGAERIFVDYEKWKNSFVSVSYDGFEAITGLPMEKVQEIARLMAARKQVTLITGKRLAHRQNSGVWRTMAMAAGWNNLPGGGWYPLDAGIPPFDLFADIDAKDTRGGAPAGGEEFGADIEESPDVSQDAAKPVKALICSGNCLYDFMSPLRNVAESTDLNIFFGAFPNATRELCHVAIPSALWPEKDSLCFSNDRAIQWADKVSEPVPECRSGLDLWTGLAQRLGDVKHLEWKAYFPWRKEDGEADHRAFHGWLLDQSPYTSGCSRDQLTAEGTGLIFWPTGANPPVMAPGEGLSGKVEPFFPPSSLQALPQTDETVFFPLIFQTTRVISRSGDASNFWPLTKDLEDPCAVQIHPEIAQVLGINSGEDVLVRGPGRVIEGRASITRMVPKWMIWSARKLGTSRAVLHKKGRDHEEAARILREFLR